MCVRKLPPDPNEKLLRALVRKYKDTVVPELKREIIRTLKNIPGCEEYLLELLENEIDPDLSKEIVIALRKNF